MKGPTPAAAPAYMVLTLLAVFMLFPFLWMLLSSFKDATQIYEMTLFPANPTVDNFVSLFLSRSSRFPQWFLNSAIVGVATTVSVLFFDSLIGYVLAKFRFPGKRIIFLLIISTLMIPTEMLVIPWYALARALKWVNSYWGIMFPGMISAFGVFLMRQFMGTMPDELIDAARVDGKGELRIFFAVVLPLAAPALAILAIFNFIGNWNAFLWPLIAVAKPVMFTIPVGLANFSGEAGSNWQAIMTGATVSMLPLVVVFLVFQKQIVKGIAMTGLKGSAMTGFSRVYVDHVLNPGYRNWKRLYYADLLAVHKAHLVMLVETGIVTRTAAAGIKASMARIEAGTPFPEHIPDAMEDLYFAFERELDRHGGENAASLHTARSRNDMDTTVFRLALKRELCDLVGHFASLAGTILARARAGQSELTVLYTHGQPANVSTMAHYLTGFLLDLLEGIESLLGAMGLTDRCPLGACAITGTGFAIDRDRTSHLLGFRSPVANSYQAIATSHWLTGPAQALEHLLSDTGRLAADMLHKAAPEVGLLVFPDELVQTSSIMPQKRNPVILEHIRIQSGLAAGSCDSIAKLFRNVPYQDVNEVADAPVSEFLDSLARVRSCASLLAAAVSGVVSDQGRARSLALAFGVTTTELADTMVRSCGVSFRSAHRACAAFVRSGYDKARLREAFKEIAGRELPLSIEEIDEALDPERFVEVRKTPGGPAPEGMESVYAAVQAAMSRIAAAIAEMDERGRSAAAELEAAWTKL